MLVHTFDNVEDSQRAWAPCHAGWCEKIDHMSVCLINQRLPNVFSNGGGGAGVVLAPHTPLACVFPHDGGTQAMGIEEACKLQHAFPTSRLADMLSKQEAAHPFEYNEVLVKSSTWESTLPTIIEAFMFITDDGKDRAFRVRSAFLHAYGLTEEDVPLLRYVQGVGFQTVA